MKRWERLAAAVLFLVGIGGAIGAWQIGFGDFQTPGPGFFPFWLALALTLLAAVFFCRSLGPEARTIPLWAGKSWLRPVKARVVMFAYVLSIGWLGFIASTALLFVAWLRIVEHSSWKAVTLLVVIGTTSLYLFVTFLTIPLPKGILI